MSEKAFIAYDISLEQQLDEIKFEMWLNEELQIQPKAQRDMIIKTLLRTNN